MMSLFRPTLVRRVVLTLLLGFPLTWVVIVSIRVSQLHQQWQDDDHDFGSTPIAANLRAAFSPVEQPEQVRTIAAELDRIRSVGERRTPAPIRIGLQILDRRNHGVVYTSPVIAGAVLQANVHHKTSNVVSGRPYDVYETDTDRWVVLWARSLLPGSNLFILKTLMADMLTNTAFALPCILLPAWLAVSFGLRPLRRFSKDIGDRGPADLAPIGTDPKHAELQPLHTALDDLLARLRRKRASEEAFVANAAHELRTPLAVIAAQAHVLGSATDTTERSDAQRQMEGAIERASHLIHQLLSLARMEMEQQEPATIDLAKLVRRELVNFIPAASQREVEISLEAPDCLVMTLEAPVFVSILQNLVDNAIRYGRDGGRVCVELQFAGDILTLSVADDGPGIDLDFRARVFDRFQRGPTRDSPGTGLGLTIVKQAARRMGGTVELLDGPNGKGCQFVVRLEVPSNNVMQER
jgi:signal transduction histidine kinase